MNTQYGNTGSFADHSANNDYDVDVVVEPAAEDVEVSIVEDDEPDIEILGAEYADADTAVSLFDGDDSYVLIDVVSEDDIDDIGNFDDVMGDDDSLAMDVVDDAYEDCNSVDDVDDLDMGGDFM